MKKQLFFDDNKLFGRENTVRKYGVCEVVSSYKDGVSSTDFNTGYVFRLDNGKYRMLYFSHSNHFKGKKLFSAVSEDGIRFEPENLYDTDKNPDKAYSHEVMTIPDDWEIGFIYEDKNCDNPEERYKMLMAEADYIALEITDTIYTSKDLLNWKKKEESFWADGTEPLASVFYNEHKKVYTIVERPFWGVRCAGYKETKDWENFSEFRLCLNVDSCDDKLDEVYGMYAFSYEGMYIGVPHFYRGLKSEYNAKYSNGIIDTQLAYSYDGRYWQRSLREPFISGVVSGREPENTRYNMLWVSNMQVIEDDIYFYVTGSELEHGPAFSEPGKGNMFIYKLRKDGFISLKTDNSNEESSVITREKVWHGGELHINIKAEEATVAVRIANQDAMVEGNVLGLSEPLEGFGHEDCIPFSGDSKDWVPQYRTGRKTDELKGKTLVFEIKFKNGELFSLAGDYTDVFNTQAARYRAYGILPE